jgi:undecaprenyl-diphosphatase
VKRLVVAFIPTGIIGFALYPFVRTSLLGNEAVVLGALFIGGVALIAFELLYKEGDETVRSVRTITYTQALFIGCFQALAIIPGVSRSAATIVGGLLTSGIGRATIVEFSFLLAVPTMVAATGYDLLKNAALFSSENIAYLGMGFITSFLVAMLAIKFFLSYVRKRSFIPFGIYRIAVALLFFIFIL